MIAKFTLSIFQSIVIVVFVYKFNQSVLMRKKYEIIKKKNFYLHTD